MDGMHTLTMPQWQRRIFIVCFVSYAAANAGRVNLSMALPALQAQFGFTGTQAGMIGTIFYWVYATGQLINGQIGDRLNARWYIFISLTGAALCNAAFGLARSLWAMALLWGLNAAFQSMLWGPMLKLLFSWYSPTRSSNVAFNLSTTIIVGTMVAVALSGYLISVLDWRFAFWAPAAILAAAGVLWLALARNRPEDVGLRSPALDDPPPPGQDHHQADEPAVSFPRLALGSGLALVALAGVMLGMVRDSIALWGPKIIMQTQGLDMGATTAVMLVVPAINACGVTLARRLNPRLGGREKYTAALLLSMCALCALALWALRGAGVVGIALFGLCSLLAAGNNPLLTTLVPLRFAYWGRMSGAAGLMGFFIYIGSGISGTLSGFFADNFGWPAVFMYWAAAALLGAVLLIAAQRHTWRYRT